MWPHSNTSGIITFITKEPFFGAAVPYKPLFLLSSPNRIKSRKRCYFDYPLPPRRNYAIVCHEFKKDTTTLEAPMTKKKLKNPVFFLAVRNQVSGMYEQGGKKVPKGHIL